MKKILLIVFVVFFLGNVFAGSGYLWDPSSAQGYTFPPVVKGVDFTVSVYQRVWMWHCGNCGNCSLCPQTESWGKYGSAETGWPIIVGTRDTNMFRAPAGCILKSYVRGPAIECGGTTPAYCTPPGYIVSEHAVTMTLNCPDVGNYTILANSGLYNRFPPYEELAYNPWWNGYTQTFYFRVIPGINLPPVYDYNLFWSIIKKDTNHFIHAWDYNETLGGNYFIKAFRVKVSPDCNIIGGGAKNLSKTQNVGTWKKTIDTPTDKKFELAIKTFQEGVDGYTGCTDTNINILGIQDGKGKTIDTSNNGYAKILIRFKNLPIPSGSTINSATLNLNSISSNTTKISVYHVWKYDWNETGASWNYWKNSIRWGYPGILESSPGSYEDWTAFYNTGDFSGYDIKSASLGSIRLVNATEAWWSDVNRAIDVTKSLQSQLDNNKFGGWLIKINSGVSGEFSNNSSCNASDPAKRPKLTVRWTEPGYLGDSKDLNNLNLYANVKCDGWEYKDFNITIWDAEDHSTDLNTVILDINAYRNDFIPNSGPPGVRINGPFYMGDHAILNAEAYGVKDYTTDKNYFFTPTAWKVCPENVWSGGTGLSGCFAPGVTDSNCTFVSEMENLYGEILDEGDYNYLGSTGGKSVFQYVFNGGYLVCYSNIEQHRKLFYLGTSPNSPGNTFFDMADVYGMDIKALLKNPYYVVLGEESTINGIAMDNSEWGGIESATWYSYDDFCGPKEPAGGGFGAWILSDQTTNFSELGSNGPDANVTAKIKCDEMPPNGETGINLAIISDKEYYPGAGKVYIRGHTRAVVIVPDSLILDSFEVVPSKVRKGNLVNFTAVVKSKYDKKDLSVEVEFKIFDKETGEEIAVISQPKTIPKLGKQTFTYSFDTSDAANPKIKQNTAYRVTATAYLKSGSGPMQDKQAVNDILERYFWVLDAEDKLSQLPETNLIGILLVLISVSLILLNTKKE
jgi:hypothetical protein